MSKPEVHTYNHYCLIYFGLPLLLENKANKVYLPKPKNTWDRQKHLGPAKSLDFVKFGNLETRNDLNHHNKYFRISGFKKLRNLEL